MKNKKGISLIVLIITIIVMVVLAAAIILMLNNSGIINRANDAVKTTDLAQLKHLATLKWSEAYLDKELRNQQDIYNYVIRELEKEVDISNYKIIVTERGVDVDVNVPTKWKNNVIDIVDTVPIPKGFVASGAAGENTKAGGLVIYEGTEAVTDSNVEEARRTRNQYVWVPVAAENFTTKFVRQNFGISNCIISNVLGQDYHEVVLGLTTNTPLAEQDLQYITESTLKEVQAMYASVKEYEGFYIARYEAGIDKHRTKDNYMDEQINIILESKVYSVMGKIPYTYIPWTKNSVMNEDTNGAVQAARSIYAENNAKYGVVSTLTYGVQWDTILQWWLDTGAVTSVTSSTGYGNYMNRVIESPEEFNSGALGWDSQNSDTYVTVDKLTYPKVDRTNWGLSTGALKAAKVNNIYDMAGNMAEWTMEGSGGTRVYRGGNFGVHGGVPHLYPVSRRYHLYGPNYASYSIGFRMSLYIKK